MNFLRARQSKIVLGESISSAFFIFMSRIHKPSDIEITGYFFRFFRESVESPDLNITKFIRAFFYPIVGIGVNFPLNALLILKKK